jgi:hypothetical protein
VPHTLCLIIAAVLALTFCSVLRSVTQLDETEAMNKKAFELYRAGKYTDAISRA